MTSTCSHDHYYFLLIVRNYFRNIPCDKIHRFAPFEDIFPQVRKTFFLKKVSSKLRYQPLHKIRDFCGLEHFLQKNGGGFPLNLNDFFFVSASNVFFFSIVNPRINNQRRSNGYITQNTETTLAFNPFFFNTQCNFG